MDVTQVLIIATIATIGVVVFKNFGWPIICRLDREEEEIDFAEFDVYSIQALDTILRNSNGRWISLEKLHQMRCKNYYPDLARYIWITERDCDTLVRGGNFAKRNGSSNWSQKISVEYQFIPSNE